MISFCFLIVFFLFSYCFLTVFFLYCVQSILFFSFDSKLTTNPRSLTRSHLISRAEHAFLIFSFCFLSLPPTPKCVEVSMWSLMFQFCAVSSKHGGFNFIVNACAVSIVHKGFDFVVNACALSFEGFDLAYMLQSGESPEPRITHALRFLIFSISVYIEI